MIASFEGFAPRRSEATGAHAPSVAVIPQHGPVRTRVDGKRRAPDSRTCPLWSEPESGQDAHKAVLLDARKASDVPLRIYGRS